MGKIAPAAIPPPFIRRIEEHAGPKHPVLKHFRIEAIGRDERFRKSRLHD